jgi:hypothetical protein
MLFSRVANGSELEMLRRVLADTVADLGIEPKSEASEALATQLLTLFEGVKDEERLGVMLRRAAAIQQRSPYAAFMSHRDH